MYGYCSCKATFETMLLWLSRRNPVQELLRLSPPALPPQAWGTEKAKDLAGAAETETQGELSHRGWRIWVSLVGASFSAVYVASKHIAMTMKMFIYRVACFQSPFDSCPCVIFRSEGGGKTEVEKTAEERRRATIEARAQGDCHQAPIFSCQCGAGALEIGWVREWIATRFQVGKVKYCFLFQGFQ